MRLFKEVVCCEKKGEGECATHVRAWLAYMYSYMPLFVKLCIRKPSEAPIKVKESS